MATKPAVHFEKPIAPVVLEGESRVVGSPLLNDASPIAALSPGEPPAAVEAPMDVPDATDRYIKELLRQLSDETPSAE